MVAFGACLGYSLAARKRQPDPVVETAPKKDDIPSGNLT